MIARAWEGLGQAHTERAGVSFKKGSRKGYNAPTK